MAGFDEPKWIRIRETMEMVMDRSPELSPLKNEIPGMLVTIRRAGLSEVVDCSFLTDDDVRSIGGSTPLAAVLREVRTEALGARGDLISECALH